MDIWSHELIMLIVILAAQIEENRLEKLQSPMMCSYDCQDGFYCDSATRRCLRCWSICRPINHEKKEQQIYNRRCPEHCTNFTLQQMTVPKARISQPRTTSKNNVDRRTLTEIVALLLVAMVTILTIFTILVAALCLATSCTLTSNGAISKKQIITSFRDAKLTTKLRESIISKKPLLALKFNKTKHDRCPSQHTFSEENINACQKSSMDNVNSTVSLHNNWSRASSQQIVNQSNISLQESSLKTMPNDKAFVEDTTPLSEPRTGVMSESESKYMYIENENEARKTKQSCCSAIDCQVFDNRIGNAGAKSTSTVAEINLCASSSNVIKGSGRAREIANSTSEDELKVTSFIAVNTGQNANEKKDSIDVNKLRDQSGQYISAEGTSRKQQSFSVSIHCADGQTHCKSVAPPSHSSRGASLSSDLDQQTGNDVNESCDISSNQKDHESTSGLGESLSSLSEPCSVNNVASIKSVATPESTSLPINIEDDENLYAPVQQSGDCDLHRSDHESLQLHMRQQSGYLHAPLYRNGPSLPHIQQYGPHEPYLHEIEPFMPHAMHNEAFPVYLHRNEPSHSYAHENEHGNAVESHSEEENEYVLPCPERSISIDRSIAAVAPEERLIEACQPQSGHHYDGLDGQRFPDEPQAAENEELLGAVGGFVGNLDEAYNDVPPPENDPLRSLPDELLPRSYDSDSGAGSIVDPAFQNRSGFHELHYDNNYIYEQLQNIPWILGYHSQGRSISIYCDLDNVEVDDRHRELCASTHQPWSKYRIKPHHD